MKLNVLDLFSGIGGFSLGLESTGYFKTIAFVEKDKFCQRVLQKNFPGIPIEDEIRNVKGKEYKADVVTGGFPCQPFSVAGKRKGTTDDRYLWDEMLKVITEVKPRWVVGENVQGIINIDNGLVLRQVQTDLESEGFQVQCFLIPASGIGAWHQRKRVWIIANSSTVRRQNSTKDNTQDEQKEFSKKDVKPSIKSSLSGNVSNSNTRFSIGENKEIQARGNTIDSSSKDVSNSNSRLRRRRGTIKGSGANKIWGFYPTQEEQTGQHIRSKTVRCDAVSGKRVQAKTGLLHSDKQGLQRHRKYKELETSISFKDSKKSSKTNSISAKSKTWWQTQSELCGVPDGISYELDKGRTNRIKSLGNAIVPQIAFEIGKAILAAEDDKID